MNRALLLVTVVACGTPAPAPNAPPPASTHSAIDPNANLEIASEEVTFASGSNTVPGTLVHPTAPGHYPGVVLMAGSGPTDRDWNSPLLPTKNGSGKLVAEALAKHGAVVLRFDKAGVGGNKTSLSNVSFDVYLDEGRAALALLRARPDVDPAHLFVAGHSEGGVHALRVATAEGPKVAGVLMLSAGGRSMKDILLGQLELQLRTAVPAQADEILASLRAALDDFLAGKTVDPTKVTPIVPLQQLLASVVNPDTAMLARGLIAFDPLPVIAKLDVPVFIYNGQHDIQVDPQLDATRLEQARKTAGKDVTLFLAPEADHVLKHEPKSVDELRKDLVSVQTNYNAADRSLDPATVGAIVGWLAAH